MQQISTKESFINNKLFKIGSVATLSVLVGLGAYLFLKSKNTKESQQQHRTLTTSQSDNNRLFKQQNWFDHRYKQVIQTVKAHFDGQNLNVQAIKSICKGQYTLAQRDYKACVIRSRQQRRQLLKQKNKGAYANAVLRSDLQIEAILQKHLNAILARFNIPRDFWMAQIGEWVASSQESSEQWQSIIQQSQNILLDTLRQSDQFFPYNTVKNVLNLKLNILKQLSPQQLDLHAAPDQTAKFNLIDKYLWDEVFKSHGVEQETLNFSLRYLKQNQKDEMDKMLDKITQKTRILLYGDDQQQYQQQQLNEEQKQRKQIEQTQNKEIINKIEWNQKQQEQENQEQNEDYY